MSQVINFNQKLDLIEAFKQYGGEYDLTPICGKMPFLVDYPNLHLTRDEFNRHLRGDVMNDRGFYTNWTGGGVVLGEDMVVQDIDGYSALDDLFTNTTPAERDTFTTTSGSFVSDGEVKRQLFFRVAEDEKKYFSKNIIGKHEDGEGTMRTHGTMCALPPSYHPDTRKPYYILNGSPDKLLPIPKYYLDIAIKAYNQAQERLAEARRRGEERLKKRSKLAGLCGLPPISSLIFLTQDLRDSIKKGTEVNRDNYAGRLAMNLVAIEETLPDFTFYRCNREVILIPRDDAEEIMREWAHNSEFSEEIAVARLDRVRDSNRQMEIAYHTDNHVYTRGNNFISRYEDVILNQPDLPIVTYQGTKKPQTIALARLECAEAYWLKTGITTLGIEDGRFDLCPQKLLEILAVYGTVHIVLTDGAIVNDGGKQVLNLQRCINKVIKDNNLNCKVVWIDIDGNAQTNHALSSAVAGVGLGYDPIKGLTANSRIREIADEALFTKVMGHKKAIEMLGGEFYQRFVTPVAVKPENITRDKYMLPIVPKPGAHAYTSPMGSGKTFATNTGLLDAYREGIYKILFAMNPRTSLNEQVMVNLSKRAKAMGIDIKITSFCPDSVLKAVNQFLTENCLWTVLWVDEITLLINHTIEGGTFKTCDRTKIQSEVIYKFRALLDRRGALIMTQAGIDQGSADHMQLLLGADHQITFYRNIPPGLAQKIMLIDAGSETATLAWVATLLDRGHRLALTVYSEMNGRALGKTYQTLLPDLRILTVVGTTIYDGNNAMVFVGDVNKYLAEHEVDLLIYNGVIGTGVSIDEDSNGKAKFEYVFTIINGGSADDKIQGMLRVRGADVKRYAYINHLNIGGNVRGEITLDATRAKFIKQDQLLADISGTNRRIVTKAGDVVNEIYCETETVKAIETKQPKNTVKIKLQQLHGFEVGHIDNWEIIAQLDVKYTNLKAMADTHKASRQEVIDEEAANLLDAPKNVDPADVMRISKKNGQNPYERALVARNQYWDEALPTMLDIFGESDRDAAIKKVGDICVRKTHYRLARNRFFSECKGKVDILTSVAMFDKAMGEFNDSHTLIGRGSTEYRRVYYLMYFRPLIDRVMAMVEVSPHDPIFNEFMGIVDCLGEDLKSTFKPGKLVKTENNTPYRIGKHIMSQMGFELKETRRGVISKGSNHKTTRWYKPLDLLEGTYYGVKAALSIKFKPQIMRINPEELSLSYFDCKSLLEPDANPVNWIKQSNIINLTGMEISLEVALDLWFAESRHIKVGDVFTLLNHGIVQVVEITAKELILVSEAGLIRAGFRSTGQ